MAEMSATGDAIRTWRDKVMVAADDLEAACAPLLLPSSALSEIPDSFRYREGAPASGLMHVEAVLELIRQLRHVVGDEGLDEAIQAADEQLP